MNVKKTCFLLMTCLLFAFADAKTILVVGDSISAGYGINPENGWVKLLEQKLQRENFDYAVINSSISGDTTSNGLTRLPNLLKDHQPVITIIELGGNDGLRATPPKKITENLNTMIALSKEINSQVLLVGIQLPPNYGDAYLARFLAIYPDLAKIHHIALLPSIVEKTGGNIELMQNDGIHPNEQGQPMMMESVWEQLLPLLSK